MSLSDKEQQRYQRQMLISGWGAEGQKKLKQSTVFIAGAGGLGCPAAIFLAAAGVGRIKLCDHGEVIMTNLNRQILYREWDVGTRKVPQARQSLMELNPHVDIESIDEQITARSADGILCDSTIILDCLDNFETRHVLNTYAVAHGVPLVHAGIEGLSGQISFIKPPETPCLYCIFPGSPPARDIFPVAGATPGVIASLQTAEALKWITGIGNCLKGTLLVWDGEIMEFQKIPVSKNPDCPVCGKGHL